MGCIFITCLIFTIFSYSPKQIEMLKVVENYKLSSGRMLVSDGQ